MADLFPERIETDRLVLEQLSPENVDVLEYYEVCSGTEMDEVTEYMPWKPHATVKESADFFDDAVERWEDGEGADYLIRPKEPEAGAGEFAGQASLDCEWDRQTGSLGTWLRKPFWGRGYSEERAMALMALAFDRLDLEVVAVTHNVDNEKSRHAIEKYVDRFGGRREGVLRNWLPYDDEVADEVRYTVSRKEWNANHPGEDAVTMRDG